VNPVHGTGPRLGYNQGMEIRPLVDADLDAALALWARTEHLGPVPAEEVASLRRTDPDLVLAAVDGGVLVGVVLGSYDGRRGWVNRLAVDPEVRRGGVGAALLDAIEQCLRDRGCVQLNLLVYAGNDGGRRFWEARGYTVTEDVVLYHRRLDAGDVPATC
jgi:ribosomal protein S18 acetylase RimI-like enzyme